ncbi:MAG TPA: hypothetical protein VFY75_04315 [Solirubrobacterales bacterium]|nr:hypothetical protein [Solirubrobacterales bacterium]
MNEAEVRSLARKLADGSDVFDFDMALEIVKWRPDEAREILQMRADMERRQHERELGAERRRRALIEDFG